LRDLNNTKILLYKLLIRYLVVKPACVNAALVKRLREERVSVHIKRVRTEKSWDEVVKEDMKREACASMMPKTETSGDDVAEEWLTPVNWEEDPTIKTEQRRSVERPRPKNSPSKTLFLLAVADKRRTGHTPRALPQEGASSRALHKKVMTFFWRNNHFWENAYRF